jgi:Skp family chaperone for outer membrane proteins
MDAVVHMKEMQKTLDSERNNYTSELQNIIDEMLSLVNKFIKENCID